MRGEDHGEGGTSEGRGYARPLDLTGLKGAPTRELLARLLDGDPLRLGTRSATRRDELAYLVSSDRLYFRTAARIAYHATVYGVDDPNDEWIGEAIDRCIEELLREDQYAARQGDPVEPEDVYAYQAVMELLDVSAESSRTVCVAFNSLPAWRRETFFDYSRARSALAEVARETSVTEEQVREDLARTLLRMLAGGANG
jgi:hypothetical protein